MRRSDICLYLGPADRAELQALLSNRNTPRKLAWRAEIVLVTADGQGTVEIMRRTGMSKPTVWRWQARYLDEGVPGLKRDKTRPSRVPPLPREVRLNRKVPFANCSIPDDHIDPRRSAFFMARSVLRDIRGGVRAC